MKIYEFTLLLDRDPSEAEADGLYGVFDDGSIMTHAGTPQIAFHRESGSLEEAIRSALSDIRTAGFNAIRVEFMPDVVTPGV